MRNCKVCDRQICQYKSRTSNHVGLASVGAVPNARSYLCEACKKFYWRYYERGFDEEPCKCQAPMKIMMASLGDVKVDQNSTVNNLANNWPTPTFEITRCRPCRLERCRLVLQSVKENIGQPDAPELEAAADLHASMKAQLRQRNKSKHVRTEFYKIPCAVCGYSSSGIHFGVLCCEGCKLFYRRSVECAKEWKCISHSLRQSTPSEASPTSTVVCPPHLNCRHCRFRRCVEAGMSPSEAVNGRLSREKHEALVAMICRLSESNGVIEHPRLRRPRALKLEAYDEISSSSSSMPSSSFGSTCDVNNGSSQRSSPMSLTPISYSGAAATTNISSLAEQPSLTSTPSSFISDQNCPLSSSSSISQIDATNGLGPLSVICPGPESTCFLIPVPSSVPFYTGDENKCINYLPPVPLLLQQPNYIDIVDPRLEISDWLIDRLIEAAGYLAPISSASLVVTKEMPTEDIVQAKTQCFTTYIRAISDFFKMMPGSSCLESGDRFLLFLCSFFPILTAQLSLSFDKSNQMPNNLSMDRNGTWQMSAAKNKHHFAVEDFLNQAGNLLVETVTSLQDFGILCALAYFSPGHQHFSSIDTVRQLRNRYELVLIHYAAKNHLSEQQVGQFYELLALLHRSNGVFLQLLGDIPSQCAHLSMTTCPVVGEFIGKFVETMTTSSNCKYETLN